MNSDVKTAVPNSGSDSSLSDLDRSDLIQDSDNEVPSSSQTVQNPSASQRAETEMSLHGKKPKEHMSF